MLFFVIVIVIVVIFTFRAVVELQIIPGETAEQVRDVNGEQRRLPGLVILLVSLLATAY